MTAPVVTPLDVQAEDHRIFDELDEVLFTALHGMAAAVRIDQTSLTVAGIEALARELARDGSPEGAPALTVAYLRALADTLAGEFDNATSDADLDRLTLARSQAAARLRIAFGPTVHPHLKGRPL